MRYLNAGGVRYGHSQNSMKQYLRNEIIKMHDNFG